MEALSIYPIFENVCKYLAPRDIFMLKATAKTFAPLIDSLFSVSWNINRFLSRFTSNPWGLRSMMARVQNTWSTGVKDIREIFIRDGYREVIDRFGVITSSHSYQIRAQLTPIQLQRVETWVRPDAQGRQLTVQIMSKSCHPLTAILGCLYVSSMMNFITWNAAYSIFPDSLFTKNKNYLMNGGPTDTVDRDICIEYTLNGFPVTHPEPGEYESTQSFQDNFRQLGDGFTWKINLDTQNVEPGAPASVIENTLFRLTLMDVRPKFHVVPIDNLNYSLLVVKHGKRPPIVLDNEPSPPFRYF
ncbi:hypothetical protein HYALB_00010975 [Hymenoscyphus albidus]|uniref:F-box domain-containing protein n=1 Tax=Hymenoscyphus albidus TaxID=595503 RepID=A0A9N9LSS8_9HELO|nr:hypothetical protein HYALB_00010975 [Hymenoscyphus albidus]